MQDSVNSVAKESRILQLRPYSNETNNGNKRKVDGYKSHTKTYYLFMLDCLFKKANVTLEGKDDVKLCSTNHCGCRYLVSSSTVGKGAFTSRCFFGPPCNQLLHFISLLRTILKFPEKMCSYGSIYTSWIDPSLWTVR